MRWSISIVSVTSPPNDFGNYRDPLQYHERRFGLYAGRSLVGPTRCLASSYSKVPSMGP